MINFRDRIKRGVQQQQPNQQWGQETNINRVNSKKDLYKQVTDQLSSQHFEAGDFRRNDPISIPISKKRNSILEMECEEDIQPPIQQQYYGGGTQRSMLNSNIADNYNGSLFESKLHETKGELCEQMSELEKRMKRQIERDRGLIEDYLSRLFSKYTEKSKEEQRKNFEVILGQLNKNLSTASKKQKTLENGLIENQQKLESLHKQFNEFTNETEQKLEKIMNSNSEVANSMKKSLSRNMGNGDYMVELKNSIKDIPVLNNGLVEEIRTEIHDLQQAIKSIRFQLMYVKEDVKAKSIVPAETQKTHPELVQASKLNFLAEQINALKNELQLFETQEQSRSKYKQLRNILEVQEQNYIGINDAFQKAVNTNIIPRIKKVEDQVQSQSIERNTEYLKKQVIKQLESMPIIRVKHMTEEQKERMERMKMVPKSQQQTYMLDELNQILDCFGNYLLDENNQRIRLQQDQIYYLQQMEGITIKMPIDVK